MKHLSLSLFGCILSLFAIPASAQIVKTTYNATVRILCPENSNDTSGMLSIIRLRLHDGEKLDLYPFSSGTGFIVSSDGYIVTNNHVIADLDNPEVSKKVILVVQRVGDNYILHRATVKRQSPNRDLAVLYCPDLRASPIPLFFDRPADSSEVYSVGFPGVADAGVEDLEKVAAKREKVLASIVEKLKAKREKVSEDEAKRIAKRIIDFVSRISVEINDFFKALDSRLSAMANDTANSWDITEVVEKRPLWKGYFTPTTTKGSIEKFTEVRGFFANDKSNIAVIQHSCRIMHGNSGGPLLNSAGEVIGVVGRGLSSTSSGDTESIQWATEIGEARDWLDKLGIRYVLGKGEPESARSRKLVIAIAVAVSVAIAALVLGVVKTKRGPLAPAGGMTTIINDRVQEAVRKLLGQSAPGLPPRPPYSSPPSFGKWQLVGRLPNGEALCIGITDVLFSNNNNKLILGRSVDLSHIVIKDSSVSKQHAHIRKSGRGFLVADRNSSNKTAVNGQFSDRPFEEVPLQDGDTLTLGDVKLDFNRV